jgi:hypothetical protein
MTDAPRLAAERTKQDESFSAAILRRLVWSRLKNLKEGRLVIEDGIRRGEFGQSSGNSLAAFIEIHDSRFYRHLVF